MKLKTPLPASGFTLIELLVVVALVAILASLLLPVFAKAREQARKTTCLSHQKQIGLGFLLYAQDYDETFPNTGDPYLWIGVRWRWPVTAYLATGQTLGANFAAASGSPSILICPSDTLSGTGFNATSYGYSACFYHAPAQINAMTLGNLRVSLKQPGAGAVCETQSLASVLYPAQKALIAEWYNSHQPEKSGRIGYWGTLVNATTPGKDCFQGARVYALADGHAKFLRAGQILPSGDGCPDIHLTKDGISGKDVGE